MTHPSAIEPDRAGVAGATAMVLAASVCFGAVPFFARGLAEAGIASPAIAFFRFLAGALLLAPFLPVSRGRRAAGAWGVLAGAMIGAGWIGYVEALKAMPVATAGVLYMTYPFFTIAVGWLVFRDAPALRAMLGAGLILAAAALAAGPAALSGAPPLAIGVALLAPLTFGAAINILTRKLSALPPLSRVASAALGAVVSLLPLVAGLPAAAVLPAGTDGLVLLAGLSLVTAVIPQLLYVIGAPRIGPERAAAAGSIELPTMFAIGWLAFAEAVGPSELLAAAMIVAAILITPARRSAGVAARLARRPRG